MGLSRHSMLTYFLLLLGKIIDVEQSKEGNIDYPAQVS
jgi:hypothetical protein